MRLEKYGLVLLGVVLLSGCETPVAGRYSISADTNAAIKGLSTSGVGFGSFSEPAHYDAMCRALGNIQIADNLTPGQYIQKAFSDEFSVAGAYAASTPRVTISGSVTELAFSSSHNLTHGSWTIGIKLISSNGTHLETRESYEFSSGFAANEACRQTADAFPRAVQDLVGKTVHSADFAALIR